MKNCVKATHQGLYAILFMLYIMVTGFIMFNLFVAVVCDSVSEVQQSKNDLDELQNEEENRARLNLLRLRINTLLKIDHGVKGEIEALAKQITGYHKIPEFVKSTRRIKRLRAQIK